MTTVLMRPTAVRATALFFEQPLLFCGIVLSRGCRAKGCRAGQRTGVPAQPRVHLLQF